ncbi:MAG: hypothetical protein HY721_25070 [Planctomycetes bacterium]|nr:hypothetical protein [Planctomycetota bacterium]
MPAPVSAAGAKDGGGAGYVTSDLGEGELTLRARGGKLYRLKWPAGERDLRRALPAGTYEVRGYRVVRRDAMGERWFISCTAGHGVYREIAVKAGEETKVRIDPAVRVSASANARGGERKVGLAIQGEPRPGLPKERRIGLSVYRGSERIPIEYRVLDSQDAVVAKGALKYG